MGLGVTLNHALAGMSTTQSGLDVLSRNVANAGVEGYHRQELSTVQAGSGVRVTAVQRAFSLSLQRQSLEHESSLGFAQIQATYLERLETIFGKPGSDNSLDTRFNEFKVALQDLATSPENFTSRSQLLTQAQALAQSLNSFSTGVQQLRRDVEAEISVVVADVNSALSGIQYVNNELYGQTQETLQTNALLDQRDRLIASVAEVLDVQVIERSDGTVSLHTRGGLNLLDADAGQFDFSPAGSISAQSLYSNNVSDSGVGHLTFSSPGGLQIDVVAQNVLQSGKLKSLIDLRDEVLVGAQSQLDEIAAALALALSSTTQQGTAVTAGAATGFVIDTTNMQLGNALSLTYTEGGAEQMVKIVSVSDASLLPMDTINADGERVIGVDFSGGMAAAVSTIQSALGAGLVVSNPSGNMLQILDDGATGNTDIDALSSTFTVTDTQSGALGLPLFVDLDGTVFTNNLNNGGQKLGFSGRIKVNDAVLLDSTLLVKYSPDTNIGSDDRPDYLISQLETMRFSFNSQNASGVGQTKITGQVKDIIDQSLNFQGNQIANATRELSSQEVVSSHIEARIAQEYGVNVDEEMARLLALQNAYAANTRIISVVQELMDQLLQI